MRAEGGVGAEVGPTRQQPARLRLIVDVGKSGTRARLLDDGTAWDAAAGGVPPDTAGGAGAGAALATAVTAVWEAVAGHSGGRTGEQVAAVVIGSTAVPSGSEVASFLAAARTTWPRAAVVLAEDGVVAHAAALGRPGVVASIGTGTIAMGLDRAGHWHRSDGWGPDLGDRGSAVWLGTHALRAAFATLDGVGPATALLEEARRYLGGADLETATGLLAHRSRVKVLAGFARIVCEAAEADAVAAELVRRAAGQAADTIAATAGRADTSTVAVLGRLAGAPPYRQHLAHALTTLRLELHEPRADVLGVDPAIMLEAPYSTAPHVVASAPPDSMR